METVQDIMIQDLLQVDEGQTNETLELMNFVRDAGTPMTKDQLEAFMLLEENGLGDIANYVYNARRTVTPVSLFYKLLDKLTLADRIKGNAKLSHLLKANANPANGALNPNDAQAKGMSLKEIDK